MAEKINLTCNMNEIEDICNSQNNCQTSKDGNKKGYVEINIYGEELLISFEADGMFWTYLSRWLPEDKAETIDYSNNADLFYVKQKWIHDNGVNIEESITLVRTSGTIKVEKKASTDSSYIITKYYGECEKTSGKRKF